MATGTLGDAVDSVVQAQPDAAVLGLAGNGEVPVVGAHRITIVPAVATGAS
jgi:hypothetical protein